MYDYKQLNSDTLSHLAMRVGALALDSADADRAACMRELERIKRALASRASEDDAEDYERPVNPERAGVEMLADHMLTFLRAVSSDTTIEGILRSMAIDDEMHDRAAMRQWDALKAQA
jgi:hypothetical protein